MTVYELIQELAQFKPDTEVTFHVEAKMDLDVEAEFDRSNEDDTQDVTVEADIDENFDYEDITNHESSYYHDKEAIINLTY